MSTVEQPTPAEEPVLPVFNNSITPLGQPPLPVITEPVPRAEIDPSVAPEVTIEYRSPVEAVPGVGGIPGVAAEE
jgi:hypothetical protein